MQAGEAIAVIILIVAVLILIYYFLINNPNISSKIKSYVPATADPHMDQILHRDGTSDYKELSSTSVACNLLFNLSIMFPSTAF